jgi:hypothetical protein
VVKALPLWQPWASLVAVEAKRIETRHWAPPRALIGQRIAIHATKTKAQLWIVGESPFAERLMQALDAGTLVEVDGQLPLGAIVATAVLDRCEEITYAFADELYVRDPDEFAFGNYGAGRFAWFLRDVERLAVPVPFRGSQGIFTVPDELLGLPPHQGTLL